MSPEDKSPDAVEPKMLDLDEMLQKADSDLENAEGRHCGLVALVGRPNVGKSTLMNYLLGEKLSITSDKPQTTRHSILGICTRDPYQIVFVDTPGMHSNEPRSLNRYMNRAARASAAEADLAVFVIEALTWTKADLKALATVAQSGIPFGLAINKIDKLKDRTKLLPWIKQMTEELDFNFEFIVPLSAEQGDNLEPLIDEIGKHLPKAAWMFPEDQITDRSERFMVAEIIREKLIRSLHQELPYATAVEIDFFRAEEDGIHIGATIWVERDGQKGIVIGKHGRILKSVGIRARQDIERLLNEHVFLETWVKVRENWTDDERALRNFGFE